MILDWLGYLFLMLTLLGAAAMLLTNIGMLYQLYVHLTLRREGLALERRRLAHPLPPDDRLPHIVIQIPSFNEGRMVENGIANAVGLDWPRDKLHIQVCDDSTDETAELARAAAERVAATGVDIVVIHRDDRTGFKAGALQAAMAQTPHEYFAIFDVDFVAPRDFLRRCMAVLLSAPKLAFVQARPDFLNAEENMLTRAQAVMLDFHYCIEQATRSWAKQALHFNGTCGIWRREAIDLGGGWRGDTLTEDWELSYHARLNGMSGTFITSVTAKGELPANLRTWIPQQQRWATGVGEVAWKMLPIVFGGGRFSAQARWDAVFPLAMWFVTSMFTVTAITMIVTMLLKPSIAWTLGLAVGAVYVLTSTVLFWLMFIANRLLGRGTPFLRFWLSHVPVPLLSLYISWAQFWSLPATILGRRRTFVRTPKAGVAANS
jgi:cellulose synthase/poly-beta-1,6-N-acetylglucosamine synthase-like glycosyltransferase